MGKRLAGARYELLALAIALTCGVLHCASNPAPVGLSSEAADFGHHAPGAVSGLKRAIHSFEGRATDFKFRLRGERPPDPRVVVAAIDEKSVQRYGLWPWPRDLTARGIERLVDLGAASVGLDLTFTDETHASLESTRFLERLDALGELPPQFAQLRDELRQQLAVSPDDALVAALKKGGPRIVQGVIPYERSDLADFGGLAAEHADLVSSQVIRTVSMGGQEATLPIDRVEMWEQYLVQMPLRKFAQTGTRFGHFATVPDVDGTTRRAAILAKLTQPKGLFPSLPLQTAAVSLGASIAPQLEDGVLVGVLLKRASETLRIPIEPRSGLMLIDYAGSSKQIPQVSFAALVDGTVPQELIKGKSVLVGVTVSGLTGDQRVTPFRELEAGVSTHAAVLSNILSGCYLQRGGSNELLEIVAMILVCSALGLFIPRLRSFALKLGVMVGAIGGWLAVSYLAFLSGVQILVVVPTLSLLASSFGVVFLGYLSVDREKLRLRSTFTRYLGADVLALALENPERLNKGEKREMTVLFADIRGFTSISERMTPELLADFINQYLSPMTQIVFDERGTLDKYIGDAVMAFWNAPLDQADHALKACRAALAMLAKLEELRALWRTRGLPELEIGIGINTGPMVVGNMGSDVRVDYTVLGDAVNLASRLEGATKEYETRIIISEMTLAAVKGQVVVRRLGAVRVKGKQVPVGIYELRGLGQPQGQEKETIETFERGLLAWSNRRFPEAQQAFEQVLETWPEDLATARYLSELAAFASRPPPADWDGVVTMHTK